MSNTGKNAQPNDTTPKTANTGVPEVSKDKPTATKQGKKKHQTKEDVSIFRNDETKKKQTKGGKGKKTGNVDADGDAEELMQLELACLVNEAKLKEVEDMEAEMDAKVYKTNKRMVAHQSSSNPKMTTKSTPKTAVKPVTPVPAKKSKTTATTITQIANTEKAPGNTSRAALSAGAANPQDNATKG